MFLGRRIGVSRITSRSSRRSSNRRRNRSQTKSNVTIRRVFPRPATFLLPKRRRRRRTVVSNRKRLRLRRSERKTSCSGRHDVRGGCGGGVRADHGGVSWSVRCGTHHHGWLLWWWC